MTAYPPKAMAVVCTPMEAEARTCRKTVGHLRINPNLARKVGLLRIPSKGVIWRAYGLIPEPYLRGIHTRIIGDVMVAGSLAGDSIGYGNRFVRWFSIRHDQIRLKRGWVKLHSIIGVSIRTILDYLVIDGHASDIAGLWPMPGRIEEGTAFFCPDSAYLAKKICNAIPDKGVVPRIRPKSNTVCKSGGSQTWGGMIRTHRDEMAKFMDEYRQRSIIGAVFVAIKKMYGNRLRSRRRGRQGREIAIRVICYNVEVVARSQVKDGRLTHGSLTAMAAGLARRPPRYPWGSLRVPCRAGRDFTVADQILSQQHPKKTANLGNPDNARTGAASAGYC